MSCAITNLSACPPTGTHLGPVARPAPDLPALPGLSPGLGTPYPVLRLGPGPGAPAYTSCQAPSAAVLCGCCPHAVVADLTAVGSRVWPCPARRLAGWAPPPGGRSSGSVGQGQWGEMHRLSCEWPGLSPGAPPVGVCVLLAGGPAGRLSLVCRLSLELPGVQPPDPGVHRAHPPEQEAGRREVGAARRGEGYGARWLVPSVVWYLSKGWGSAWNA